MLQAVFVTFLWSTSWVLIKVGLQEQLPALTFAGLRYMAAFLCLSSIVLLSTPRRAELCSVTRGQWLALATLGLLFYTLTQGAQFLSLAFLPAAMTSLLLNLTPAIVAILGIALLHEQLSRIQVAGMLIALAGVGLYFLPFALPATQVLGILVAIIGVVANAGSALMGRYVNRQLQLSALVITMASMGIGASVLLLLGLGIETRAPVTWQAWILIGWLAIVNTAFAFTLWNHTLRTLTAIEASLINGLMLPEIALLAVFLLGETLTAKEIAGLVLVTVGTIVVQAKRPIPA